MADVDRWEELQREHDLLALAIATEVLRARHREPSREHWDNAAVSRERRAAWRARDERAKAGRKLTRLLRRIYD